VRLGFCLLEDLVRFLSPMPEPGESYMPRWVAWKWHRRARRIFKNAPAPERELGSRLILLGVRPTDNSGCFGGGHPDVIVLDDKAGFEPEYSQLGDVKSIGSGNDVESYMTELKAFQLDNRTLMQAEIGRHGGMGNAWTHSLARMVRANPVPGISQFVHQILVFRDRVSIEPMNLTKISGDGVEVNYQMPQVVA